MVYWTTFGSTTIILPWPANRFLGASLQLGWLFYAFMGCLAVFCTNAINILAGVNGLEASQALVIAVSALTHNAVQLWLLPGSQSDHLLSIYFLLPFVGVTSALLLHNWYPASVFVGDTFCYFSGMTFAVVAILGHYSKTMLLFFIPQTFNFLYSCPQLFHLLPCPRHRMPKLNPTTGLLDMSTAVFPLSSLSLPGRLLLRLLKLTGFAYVNDANPEAVVMSNLTIINLTLKLVGPQPEARLTLILVAIQSACSLLAFAIRYGLAAMVYDHVR